MPPPAAPTGARPRLPRRPSRAASAPASFAASTWPQPPARSWQKRRAVCSRSSGTSGQRASLLVRAIGIEVIATVGAFWKRGRHALTAPAAEALLRLPCALRLPIPLAALSVGDDRSSGALLGLMLGDMRPTLLRFEMIRSDAMANAADVMQDLAGRNRPVDMAPRHAMGVAAVEVPVPFRVHGADPGPAASDPQRRAGRSDSSLESLGEDVDSHTILIRRWTPCVKWNPLMRMLSS